MKKRLKYFVLVFMVLIVTVLSTLTILFIKYDEGGDVTFKNKYYEILFGNVNIDFDTTMSVKVNYDKHEIVVKIPNITEFNEEKSFNVNLTNIGNIDSKVNKLDILNVVSDTDINSVVYDISFKEGDVIEAGDSAVINVKLKNNNTKVSGGYFNFVIKYKFNEVVL